MSSENVKTLHHATGLSQSRWLSESLGPTPAAPRIKSPDKKRQGRRGGKKILGCGCSALPWFISKRPPSRSLNRACVLTGCFWMGYPGCRFGAAAWNKAQRSRELLADRAGNQTNFVFNVFSECFFNQVEVGMRW